MAKRLNIGLDVDGVLADFISAFLKEAETLLGRKITGTQTTWDFEDSLTISHSEVRRVWQRINDIPNWFFISVEAYPEVVNYLIWLTEHHNVYFITSRRHENGFTSERQTQMFLDNLGVQFPNVIANKEKGALAAALELDYFLDDYPENVESVERSSPKTRCYLLNRSYNADSRCNRVGSFASFIDIIGGTID